MFAKCFCVYYNCITRYNTSEQEIKKDATKISQIKDTVQMANTNAINGRNGR